MIYQPASNATANMMRSEIQDCINTYYSNIDVTQIDIGFYGNEIHFEVHYRIANTNTVNKLALMFIKSGQYLV